MATVALKSDASTTIVASHYMNSASSVHYAAAQIMFGADGATPTMVTSSVGLPVSDAGGSLTVDNGGTFVVQENGAALTALQLIDNTVQTSGDGFACTSLAGRYYTVEPGALSDSWMALRTDASGQLYVRLSNTVTIADGSGSITVDNAGTFAVQASCSGSTGHDTAAAGINPTIIGGYASAAAPSDVSADTDAVRAWHLRSGAYVTQPTYAGVLAVAGNGASGTGVQRVTIANDSTGVLATVSTLTTLTGGGVAHDSVDSGNPVKMGARCAATLSDDTMVANADRTDLVSDLDGALIVRQGCPLGDLLSERVTNTDGTSTASTVFGATASTRNVITGYSVYNSSGTDGYIDFRDGTGGAVLWTVPLPTLGGANFAIPGGIFRTTANTALAFDVSGALSTVYISVSGFKSKVT